MKKQPKHRPQRNFPNAKRVIVECELEKCIHCEESLVSSKTWHMRKNVQTMAEPLFVAGKSKKCINPECSHEGHSYHASGVLKISLPHSTYGLDVLAYIGWQHEQEHKQFVEIQKKLNERGVAVNERNVGKLYRQFLALLGGLNERIEKRLRETAEEHGGLIWGIDALKPEGDGTLLYVLYEVLSCTPVAAIQANYPSADELVAWLEPYRELPYKVLATLSDGEDRIIAALKRSWSEAARQRCQEHILGNLAEPVLKVDTKLRQQMKANLGGLPPVPDQSEAVITPVSEAQPVETAQSTPSEKTMPSEPQIFAPPFCLLVVNGMRN